ncbi:MAG: DUF2461 domain-containing protein [Gammaproteobacteria bacterium]|nr:DUF2461 domain-containing protein [Gammaproteobacteria bacterium]NNE04600.1 DUF2461 domain-containing protein [Xanthomonadales bacterium]
MSGFEGFKPDFFRFFRELKRNNDRDWFAANKQRYLDVVVAPMGQFIEAIAPRLHVISKEYRADPRPHGGSMFRIYRDTRFSKDKTPYKTHAACHFRHRAGKDAHAPGFYAHFELDRLMLGGGIWQPPAAALLRIREFIVDNPAEWQRIRSAKSVRQRGGIQGDSLVRPPRGFDPEHRHIEDLKRKSFYVMEEADPALLKSRELVNRSAAAFRAAGRLNRYVCDALELPF